MIGENELAALIVRVAVVEVDGGGRAKIMNPLTTAKEILKASGPDLLAPLERLYFKTVVGTEAERHQALDLAWRAISEANA